MSDTLIAALISAGGSVLVAMTALILNYRGFVSIDARITSLDNRITSLESRIDSRFANLEDRIERRLDAMQADLKEFYRLLAEHDKRISRLEDKQ